MATPRPHPYAVVNSRPAHTGASAALVSEMIHFLGTDTVCPDKLARYQAACLKADPERANALFTSAKTLANEAFGSIRVGMTYVRAIEQAHPGRDPVTGMPLSKFEEVRVQVGKAFARLPARRRRELLRLVTEHEAAWTSCYTGRRVYRMDCEKKRDEGHSVAYWIFKLALIASRALTAEQTGKM